MRSSSTGRRRSRTSRSCDFSPRRGSARTSRRSGELRFAQAASVPAERLVVHGNNKSDEELRAAAEAQAGYVVLDSVEELDRARAAGLERMLARVTPGIEAETHEAIRTGHVGSKFGMSPEEALGIRDALAGLHVHIGSQLLSTTGARQTLDWVNRFLAESGWSPEVLDLGGGLGVPTHPSESSTLDRGARRASGHRAGNECEADPRARPFAGGTRRGHALPRRLGEAGRREDVGRGGRWAVGQPSTAALRCAVHGDTGPPRRPEAGADGRDRGPALRVGGRPDRRSRACRSRAAAISWPSRRPGHTRCRWARTTT